MLSGFFQFLFAVRPNAVSVPLRFYYLLADVSSLLANMRIMINDISTRNMKDGRAVVMVTVSVNGVEHLNSLVSKIKKIDGVLSIERSGV